MITCCECNAEFSTLVSLSHSAWYLYCPKCYVHLFVSAHLGGETFPASWVTVDDKNKHYVIQNPVLTRANVNSHKIYIGMDKENKEGCGFLGNILQKFHECMVKELDGAND